MNETVILDESFVRMKYLHHYRMVEIEWIGALTIEQYQFAFSKALEFLDQHDLPIQTYMSDIRNQSVVNPQIRKWVESYAIPQAIKRGLRRGVVVFDGTVFKKYYLNLILLTFGKFKIPFRFFRSHDEAMEWVQSFED